MGILHALRSMKGDQAVCLRSRGRTCLYCVKHFKQFSKEALDILDAFSVFNAVLVSFDTNSNIFSVYGNKEIVTLQNHYFKRRRKLWQINGKISSLNSCRYESGGLNLGKAVESNKMKVKVLATE